MQTELSDKQRTDFIATSVEGVPVEVVERLMDSNAGKKNASKHASVAVGKARDRSRNRVACRVPLQAARSSKARG